MTIPKNSPNLFTDINKAFRDLNQKFQDQLRFTRKIIEAKEKEYVNYRYRVMGAIDEYKQEIAKTIKAKNMVIEKLKNEIQKLKSEIDKLNKKTNVKHFKEFVDPVYLDW